MYEHYQVIILMKGISCSRPFSNRYAEQVIPLLVQAQHFLERRVKQSGGPAPPQPHFQLLQRQLGHVVRAKDYLRAQLLLEVDKEGLAKTIQPGAQIDPLGHNTYSGKLIVHCNLNYQGDIIFAFLKSFKKSRMVNLTFYMTVQKKKKKKERNNSCVNIDLTLQSNIQQNKKRKY